MTLVRLPVIQDEMLLGVVTRTDILRQLHQLKQPQGDRTQNTISTSIQARLENVRSAPPLSTIDCRRSGGGNTTVATLSRRWGRARFTHCASG